MAKISSSQNTKIYILPSASHFTGHEMCGGSHTLAAQSRQAARLQCGPCDWVLGHVDDAAGHRPAELLLLVGPCVASEAKLWLDDSQLRARARAISSEMSTGFLNVRNEMPMNYRGRASHFSPSDVHVRARAEPIPNLRGIASRPSRSVGRPHVAATLGRQMDHARGAKHRRPQVRRGPETMSWALSAAAADDRQAEQGQYRQRTTR